MKKFFIFGVIFLSLILAHASTPSELVDLLDDIQKALKTSTAPEEDLLDARDHLAEALSLIRGNGSIPSTITSLVCTPRDNDGANPYILAIKDHLTLSETRIPGTIQDKPDCELSRAAAKQLSQAVVVCGSRDNDSKAPFAAVAFNTRTKTTARLGVFSHLTNCLNGLAGSVQGLDHLVLCASRDNDGVAPFVAYTLNAKTLAVGKGSTNYQNTAECESNL